MPELEDLTMKMAEAAGINVVPHTLVCLSDGEFGYLTKRIDRSEKGDKYSMLDMCQLTNRLTEHKYYGTYTQLADTVKKYSSMPGLDVQKFWEVVLFSWIVGNSDMHCKNFSLISQDGLNYRLSPAYDLINVKLSYPQDVEEMAMAFSVGGEKTGFDKKTFTEAFEKSGMNSISSEKLIARMLACKDKWEALISASFLPDGMKTEYRMLIAERLSRLV